MPKFDCVVGNPPYQSGNESKGNKLWPKFIQLGINILKDDGYLGFITPVSWINGSKNILKDIFLKFQLNFLDMNTAKKYFPGVGSTFSWYIIEKTQPYKETGIKYLEDDIEYINNISLEEYSLDIFPKIMNKEIKSILNKIDINPTEKIKAIVDRRISQNDAKKNSDNDFKYRMYNGKSIMYMSCKFDNYNDWKLIFPVFYNPKNFIIDKDCGNVGSSTIYIRLKNKEEGEYIKNLFNSKLYKFYFNLMNTNGRISQKIYNLLPYPKNLDIENLDKELYVYFDLTEEEINYIEDNVKPLH